MSKSYNHFESHEWLGLFWTPNEEIEFPGKLVYTPEDGITLEFMCSAGQKFEKSSYIHGALATGEKCTLLGNFDSAYFGFHFGEISIYKGKPKFYAAIFGVHTTPDEKFPGFSLDITNFQEFCHPQGWKDLARYSTEPLFKSKIDELEISIINTGKFSFPGKNLENLFHCKNKVVVEKISKAIFEISQEHKDEEILQRKDIGWELWAESSIEMCYSEISKNIELLEHLIALLIFSPVCRTEASILRRSNQVVGKFERLPLLSSLFDISKYKIEVLQREISNFHQAITPRTINNFAEVISNWFKEHEAYQPFVSQIANRFGRYHEHELKAVIVLQLVQLEAISISLGNHKDKYDFPLEKYDKTNIRDSIKSIFGLNGDTKIGKNLSKLRGEIAHLAASNKILSKIGLMGLLKISRCLEIVIASHIYERLGIPSDNIAEFQRKENQ